MSDEKWKEQHLINKAQNEIAEEIKNELLKRFDLDRQRNVVKETINAVKRRHRL